MSKTLGRRRLSPPAHNNSEVGTMRAIGKIKQMLSVGALLVALIIGLIAPAEAQITNPAPVMTDQYVDLPENTLILFGKADTADSNFDEKVGTPLAYMIRDQDSVYAHHNHNKSWAIAIQSKSGTAYGYSTTLLLRRTVTGPTGTSSDTFRVYAAPIYNYNVFDEPGIDFIMDSTAGVGDQFKVTFRTMVPLKVDARGELKISTATSRMTLIENDTLTGNTDTIYGLGVWGGYRWMNWGFKGITSSMGDDGSNWFGLGVQNKFGNDWYEIIVVSDSFRIPLTVARDTSFSRAVADSSRIVIWGNTTTKNYYLEFLKWIGRN